jgi:hypothetical protein
MAKGKRSANGGQKNSDRRCGKAFKKNPKQPNKGKTGRTIAGYSPAKLELRAKKRASQES